MAKAPSIAEIIVLARDANSQRPHESTAAYRVLECSTVDGKNAGWSPAAAEKACAAAGQSSYREAFFSEFQRYPRAHGWPVDQAKDGTFVSLKDGSVVPRNQVK